MQLELLSVLQVGYDIQRKLETLCLCANSKWRNGLANQANIFGSNHRTFVFIW